MKLKSLAAASALGLPLAMATPAYAVDTATVQLDALNNSGSSGTAELVFDDSANTLVVNIDATGLVPNLPHAQHIHIGGQNICPPASAAGEDSILTTPEGQPFYGGIQVSLTTEGDFGPDSALAVDRFPVASADGEVSYTRTFDLSEVAGDVVLDDVAVVQHGIDTISPNGQYGPPPPASELDPSLPLEATAPANCGVVEAVSQGGGQMNPMPSGGVQTGGGGTAGIENQGLLTLGALGLLGAGALTLRRRTSADSR